MHFLNVPTCVSPQKRKKDCWIRRRHSAVLRDSDLEIDRPSGVRRAAPLGGGGKGVTLVHFPPRPPLVEDTVRDTIPLTGLYQEIQTTRDVLNPRVVGQICSDSDHIS